ncbi:MAG TPA: hypothetical protein VFD43_11955 [Planctomycetota bacterium]|nr:hypothetical protein [Planctomycetota bacterium]
MNDLIRSEWRRFRRLALIVALCHGLGLLLLSRAVDVLQLGSEDQGAMLVLYMVLGLALALLQVGSYRKTSRWLWLIHRPLAPARIFAALALSALAQLCVGVLAPLLVFLVATDAFTTQVVDSRHYVASVLALAFTLMAWLAGAHACTSRHKVAVAVLLAPLMLALHPASVWWLLLPVLACLAWLAFVARHSFRADRAAPIARHGVLLLTALPMQLGFFLLVFELSKAGVALFELLGRSNPGRTVLTTDTDVDVDAMLRNWSRNFLALGLENSRDPRVAMWREQLPLLQMAGLTPDIERFPVRHQLGNVASPWWDDTRKIQWTFSHDRMQFLGRDLSGGATRGWWGASGIGAAEPFAEVPAFGMTRDVLYTVDLETQRQHELVRLPAGEWFMGRPVNALDRVLLQTNRRLLAYRPDREALSPFAPPLLDWQLPLPPGEPPPMVEVFELLDGWLVSLFYFDEREFDGFESLIDPWQQVVHLDADGRSSVVGERRNIRGHSVSVGGSAAVPVASWWVSPALYALAHLPDRLDTGLTQPPRFEPLPRVPLFRWLAGALMLASLAAGSLWLRGTRVGAARRRLWLVSCVLLGVPALLSLICLEPRRARA